MKGMQQDGKLVILLENRIDTNNAAAAEQEIRGIMAEHAGLEVVFDAKELEYISSAGLRVLMKVRKMYDKPLQLRSVSRDIYDILETTGFTEIFQVQKAYRRVSIDGLEMIGKGFCGTVYRLDAETIVKVYEGKDSIPVIENEKQMAQKAFLAGIPTAISYDIVQVGDNYGSVFELLNAKTFHDMAKEGEEPLEQVIQKYVDMLKLVHQTKMKSGDFPSCKERYLEYLEYVRTLLKDEQYEGLRKLLLDMEEEYGVVHGDIQMKNVMQTGDEAMLIDMDMLGLGNPVFEFAGLYVTYQAFEEDDPDNAMSFLGMSQGLVEEIWYLIVEKYFSFHDVEERDRILSKIQLTGSLRFLYLLASSGLLSGDLGKRRVEHTKEHIDELLLKVDRLAI